MGCQILDCIFKLQSTMLCRYCRPGSIETWQPAATVWCILWAYQKLNRPILSSSICKQSLAWKSDVWKYFRKTTQTNYALSTALCHDQQYYVIKSLLSITIYHGLPNSPQVSRVHTVCCSLHIALVETVKLTVNTSLCTLHQVLDEYSSGPACSVQQQTARA